MCEFWIIKRKSYQVALGLLRLVMILAVKCLFIKELNLWDILPVCKLSTSIFITSDSTKLMVSLGTIILNNFKISSIARIIFVALENRLYYFIMFRLPWNLIWFHITLLVIISVGCIHQELTSITVPLQDKDHWTAVSS